jgi:hypothetical protein
MLSEMNDDGSARLLMLSEMNDDGSVNMETLGLVLIGPYLKKTSLGASSAK